MIGGNINVARTTSLIVVYSKIDRGWLVSELNTLTVDSVSIDRRAPVQWRAIASCNERGSMIDRCPPAKVRVTTSLVVNVMTMARGCCATGSKTSLNERVSIG